MILAIDPSSTCTGWAVFDGAGQIVDHGRVKPDRGDTPAARVSGMIFRLKDTAAEYRVSVVVIEEPAPNAKVAFTSIPYVTAYGRIYEAMRTAYQVETVAASKWTGGRRKPARAAYVKAEVPTYTGKGDSGMDEADAIGLGLWWTAKRRLGAA